VAVKHRNCAEFVARESLHDHVFFFIFDSSKHPRVLMQNPHPYKSFAASRLLGTFATPVRVTLAFVALLASCGFLCAQTTYSWDANGGGAGSGGSGSWGSGVSATNWTANGSTYFVWTSITNQAGVTTQSDAIASFGGTAGTVTNANSYTANSLVFSSSGYVLTRTASGNRTLTLSSGNVTVDAGVQATITGNIDISGTSGFTKLGDGTLVLGNATNTATGAISINGGTLKLAANQVFGGVTKNFAVASGAMLDLAGFALTNAFSSSAGTITSSSAGASFGANTTSAADFSGVLSGSVSFTKDGSATLTLSGSSANTYAGTTTVAGGSLTLNKTAGVNAIAADLVIGDGSGIDRVNLSAANQIADTSIVTLGSSGTAELRLNGNAETIGALVGGASGVANVLLGTGGSLTIAGTSTGSFAGNINLTNGTLTVGGAANASISGVVSGTGGNLVKTGTGTLTLSATNTYSGATTISNGTVAVNGRVSGSGVTVKNGGELAGTGIVGSAVIESGGTISPGSSPGTMTLTNGLTWNAGGNYDWEIYNLAGPAGTGWDLINVQGGAFTFSGLSAGTPFNINIYSLDGTNPDSFGPLAGLSPLTTYSWKILQHNTAITGFNAANFTLNSAFFTNNVSSGLFSLELGDGNTSIYLVYTTGQAVPEPGTWAAAALLAAAAGYVRLRRRKQDKVEIAS
jgi:autotransporter-associated beta strand protein